MGVRVAIRNASAIVAITAAIPSMAIANDVPLISPQSLVALAEAVQRYKSIADAGDWQRLPSGSALRLGASGQRVVLLRERLKRTHDLSETGRAAGQRFDQGLKKALMRFQRRHGLVPSGVVYHDTRSALNVPVSSRLKQLRENYSRLLYLVENNISAANVVVNVPGFELEAVAQGRVALRSRVVVGHPKTPTPALISAITSLTLLPEWRVPARLAARDIIPLLQWDRGTYQRLGMRAFAVSNGQREEIDPSTINWFRADRSKISFRQNSGPRNVMGLVRINMPNDRMILLHDTPKRELFRHIAPAFSAGCVRVNRVFDLAVWLLRNQPDWDRAQIEKAISAGKKKTVPLSAAVPVRLVYLTAWKRDGTIHFRPDIYGRDTLDTAMRAAAHNNRKTLAKAATHSKSRPKRRDL
jgi:murein L,D-transpeptidase YcbB/YkuD